jgi:hypothetical protein
MDERHLKLIQRQEMWRKIHAWRIAKERRERAERQFNAFLMGFFLLSLALLWLFGRLK